MFVSFIASSLGDSLIVTPFCYIRQYFFISFFKGFNILRLKLSESGYVNMFKTLVSLILCLFLVFFFFEEKNIISPVFQLTETPAVITKGQYGSSVIVELSYSHNGLIEWIASLREPYPLFLVDTDWLLRSPDIIKLLIEQNIEVGLLGSTSEKYEDETLLEKQLAAFQKTFHQLPLWFATADYKVDSAMQANLHARGINLIAPTVPYTALNAKLSAGDFVSIPLHRDENISFDDINQLLSEHSFISIEENIFGYEISTKRFP